MSANNWCTIESDPGVFTELIQEMGVTGVQVEELYQLDKEFMDGYAPVYGLVFLFKWRANERDDRVAEQEPPPGVFFASQVINNACATQAILSILLNTPDINLGHELVNFKTFTKDFPPQLKGLAISNSDLVRKAHNSFARAEPFIMTGRTAEKDDELFHFISYVPIDGKLYELDGLKPGPICLGECSDEDCVTPDEMYLLLSTLNEQLTITRGKIRIEEDKFLQWKIENVRRKHNYVPFVLNFISLLAKKRELMPLVEKSKQKPRTSA
ncbi:ubiquitin carboxyl-terminal hydrolase [Pavlovales sp. CCMP2436]|nr:ubiquitin carboxyl-terminal hydrolase [Pavlovales sp. CCMP2436]